MPEEKMTDVEVYGPRFTVDSECEHEGWSISGVMSGLTKADSEVDGVVTLEQAFMVPGGSHHAPETYMEFGDMVSSDAEMSARTYNGVVSSDKRHDFHVMGNPPWFHLGTVAVKEEYRGQRLSHRMVSGFIEFIESFVGVDTEPYVLTATCVEGLVPHWEAIGFKVWDRVPVLDEKTHVLLVHLGGELAMPPALEVASDPPTPRDLQDRIKRKKGAYGRTGASEATRLVFEELLRSTGIEWDVRLMVWVNNDGGLAHAPCFPIVCHNREEGRVLLLGTEYKGWWAVGRRVVELRGTGEYRGANKSRFKVVRQSDPFGGRGWRGAMLRTGFSWAVEALEDARIPL